MLNVIKTALNSNSHKISVVSNNIANAGTTAFKRSEAIFEDFYLQAEREGFQLEVARKFRAIAFRTIQHN